MTTLPNYPDCSLKRPVPILAINQDVAKSIGSDYRVLPIFEKSAYEYSFTQFYSLQTNEFLKCRWRSYIRNFDKREFAPFKFIDVRDFHFCNSKNRLLPSESIHTRKDFRFKLKVGPGVDFRGQMPIPQDLYLKRGLQKAKPKAAKLYKPEHTDSEEKIDEKKNN